MKLRKLSLIIYLSILLFDSNLIIYSQNHESLDCFTIVVGRNVSFDGSVIIAHNEDDFGKQIVNLYKVPALNCSDDKYVQLDNGGLEEQVDSTKGYFWIELPGMKVADSFINDSGVLVTSNGCPSKEENPDSSFGGILYWLRRLVAERANSALEAVKIAGKLIDKYGYISSGRTYTFADRNEAWIFSAVYGKHWIAQRVPDDEVAVIPNYYTIGEIDLNDTTNFLASQDIVDYSIKNGWYNPKEKQDFDFAKAYTNNSSLNHPGNVNRMWRGINLLARDSISLGQDFPFSFIPYKKLNISDLKKVLRDHYELCKFDVSDVYRNGNPHQINYATICSQSTQYSFITQLRPNLPPEIGTLIWLSFIRPDINIYAPIYLGLKGFPKNFAYLDYKIAQLSHNQPADSIFNENKIHVYWDFVRVVNRIDKEFLNFYPIVQHENSMIEQNIFKNNITFDNKIITEYLLNKKIDIEKISNYSEDNLLFQRNRALEILYNF